MKDSELYKAFNDFLYKMCSDQNTHNDIRIIYLKTLIIGRTYSASPERYKGRSEAKGSERRFWMTFCLNVKKSTIDKEFHRLNKLKKKKTKQLTERDKEIIKNVFINVHKIFSDSCPVQKKSKKPNRISFTSKYLHFHFPDLFYIYDSNAKKSLETSTSDYEKFWDKCHEALEKEKHINNPRALDNFLLKI